MIELNWLKKAIFLVVATFFANSLFAAVVENPEEHAFHVFTEIPFFGVGGISSVPNVGLRYTLDIPEIPAGSIVDELYLKISFNSEELNDLNRIVSVQNCSGYDFTNVSEDFHHNVNGRFLVLSNNFVGASQDVTVPLPSCWSIVVAGSDNVLDEDIFSISVNITYHRETGVDNSVSPPITILKDYYASDGYTGVVEPQFNAKRTLSQVSPTSLNTEQVCDNVQGTKIEENSDNLIIFVHGWNPSGKQNHYAPGNTVDCVRPPSLDLGGGEGVFDLQFSWFRLAKNLLNDKLIARDWVIARYDWAEDAYTGEIPSDSWDSADQSRDRSHVHGLRLGKIVEKINPKRVQFIAHSAGNWAVRRASDYLKTRFSNNIEIEHIALDPFVNDFDGGGGGEFDQRLEDDFAISHQWTDWTRNYYVDDPGTLASDVLGYTSGDYIGWTENRGLDESSQGGSEYASFMDDHSGPIYWYGETVSTDTMPHPGFQVGLPYNYSYYQDSDLDTIPDGFDNCLNNPNKNQNNFDGDKFGDACDSDDDNDGMSDSWEIANGLNPKDASDKNKDPDGDGRNNLQEYRDRTNPNIADEPREVSISPIISLLLEDEEVVEPVDDLDRGLLAYYKFEENFDDSSAPSNNAAPNGGINYVDGIDGQAARFDGVDDWGDLGVLGDVDNFTVNVWARDENPDNFTAGEGNNGISEYFGVIYKGNLSSHEYDFYVGKAWTDIHMRTGTGLDLNFYAHNGVRDDSNIVEGKWTMFTYVFGGQKGRIYQDGVEISESNSTNPLNNDYSNWYLARRWLFSGVTNYWKGDMDELRIYDRPLQQEEIMELFTQLPRSPSNLQAHYKFDNGFENSLTSIDDADKWLESSSVNIGSGVLNLQNSSSNDSRRKATYLFDSTDMGQLVIEKRSQVIALGEYSLSGVSVSDGSNFLRLSYNYYHHSDSNNAGQYSNREHFYLNNEIYNNGTFASYESSNLLDTRFSEWIREVITIDFEANRATYKITDDNGENLEVATIDNIDFSRNAESEIVFSAWDWSHGTQHIIDDLKIYSLESQ